MNDNNKYKGLTGFEAQERLMRYGKNVISNHKRKSALGIFLAQFADFMVMILIICTIISAIMGDVIESYVIIAIVIINAILGFAQEFKTEKTMEALKGLTAPKARVLRDGSTVTIPAERVVPGDIAFLNAGDRIPADGRILDCTGMSLDESMLTGESMPVQKEEGFLFSGTLLLTGHGTIKVVSTGMNTEMGKIAGMIQEVKETETPLQKRLSRLGVFIIIGCLIICAIVAITGVLRGEPAFSMLLTGISLAVAAVPEGLPAIVTISLAMGVQRMMARNALVRKLPAVETLGSTNIICSDKTGTLTQNKMTVRIMTTISEILAAHAYKDPVDLIKVKEICLTCSNSSDPTERALEEAAGDINIEGVYNRIGENPFDSKRKCMSVIVENKIGEKYIFAKGAVDVLLEKCIGYQQAGRQYSLEPGMKHKTAQYCNTLAQDALRVLGMAYRKLGPGENINLGEKLEKNLIMTGVAGLIDPPRPEVAEAVTMCRSAGIRTVMITGDHKATATAIGKELDILRKGDKVMTGDELEHTGDEELARQIPKISIFARVMPAHKLRIVKTLKKLGNIVAMTGDGVNDAPAVKEADIGVSMGINGTDVTREASSMVLLDDNFATIVAAIVQGREIYDNIKKFIRYMLTCNLGEVITMFVGMLLGFPLPLFPIQILWVNLATDGLPAIALGLDPADEDIMNRDPVKSSEGIFAGHMMRLILIRGVLTGLSTLGAFSAVFFTFGDIDAARTTAFMTLVLIQLVYAFECRSLHKTIFEIDIRDNLWLVASCAISLLMMLAVVYIPALSVIFRTVPLEIRHWVIIAGITALGPILGSFLISKK